MRGGNNFFDDVMMATEEKTVPVRDGDDDK